MKKEWFLIFDGKSELQKKAVKIIKDEMLRSGVDNIVICSDSAKESSIIHSENVVVVGTQRDCAVLGELISAGEIPAPQKPQGFSLCVKNECRLTGKSIISVCGYDDAGVLYGAVEFVNKYSGYIIFRGCDADMEHKAYFESAFNSPLTDYSVVTAPAVETRGIWTWGYTIGDYRGFFDNMVMLKLNEIVIWNDYLPLNSDEIVEYAHSCGIRVFWGYAWGWDTDCNTSMGMDEKSLQRLKADIIKTYETEYAHSAGDGIYFQSCTELGTEYVNGKLIAETVVGLVNETSYELLKKHPDLNIQFGLHASSVRNRLEYIKNVDPRVKIVWENCGEFPFFANFTDHKPEDELPPSDETVAFTKKIVALRAAEEKCGLIFKGVCSLDWSNFVHRSKRERIGEKSDAEIDKKLKERRRILKIRQALWIRYPERVREIVKAVTDIRKDNDIKLLVEDCAFEREIPLPAAIFAEILWNNEENADDVVCDVIKYPCVVVANL